VDSIKAKIQNWEAAEKSVTTWQTENQKVVFTNGCFDILHYGHLHYLADAKALGDKLIVGLNSDASVSRLKGEHRPINEHQIVGSDLVIVNGGKVLSLPFVKGYSTTNIEQKIRNR